MCPIRYIFNIFFATFHRIVLYWKGNQYSYLQFTFSCTIKTFYVILCEILYLGTTSFKRESFYYYQKSLLLLLFYVILCMLHMFYLHLIFRVLKFSPELSIHLMQKYVSISNTHCQFHFILLSQRERENLHSFILFIITITLTLKRNPSGYSDKLTVWNSCNSKFQE